MSGTNGGDFMLESPDSKPPASRPPPIAQDSLKDPLTSSEVAKPPAQTGGVAKEMSGGGDFTRLPDKLPI